MKTYRQLAFLLLFLITQPASSSANSFTSELHRFWSDTYGSHFFTIDASERNEMLSLYPDHIWRYEGVDWYAYAPGNKPSNTNPVYRFWSDVYGSHFFTMDEEEKDYIIATYPEEIWDYEGIAWYAYKPGNQPADTKPVYRFWSHHYGSHFLTIDEIEKN